MFNYLLLILCAVVAVQCDKEGVNYEECREDDRDDSTYSYKSLRSGSYDSAFLKPNNEVHTAHTIHAIGTSACFVEDSFVPSTSGECVQRLINYCAYNDLNTNPDLPVVGVIDTKLLDRKQLTPFEVMKTSSVYVENDSEIQQEAQTTEYTEETTSAFEFSMTQSVGMTASVGFGIPLIGETKLEISTEFSFAETWASSVTKSITFPSQKVLVPPKSRIRLTYDVMLAKFDTKYASSFVLDPNHDMIKRCVDKLPDGTFSLNLDKDGMGNETRATFTTTQQTLNNLPITYISEVYEIKVYISEAEPISTAIDDKSVTVVNVLNLPSTNIFTRN